ncbi:unnamed protein product, partial [Amoebophrya sp. A25]
PEYLATADPGLFWTLVRHASNLYLPAEAMGSLLSMSAFQFKPSERTKDEYSPKEDQLHLSDHERARRDAEVRYAGNKKQTEQYLQALNWTTCSCSSTSATSSSSSPETNSLSSSSSFLEGIVAASLSRYALIASG